MKKIVTILLTLVALGALASTMLGAAFSSSNIESISVPSTVNGMTAAINGEVGTLRFVSPNNGLVVLGWPSGEQFGWIVLDQKGNLLDIIKNVCGQKACPGIATDFMNFLKASNYQAVEATALPPAVVMAVRQCFFLLSVGQALPTFIVLPTNLIHGDPLDMLRPTSAIN
jgi:hypothetical protein